MSLKRGNTSVIATLQDSAKRFDEEITGIYASFSKKRTESLAFCQDFKESDKIHRRQMKEIKTKHRNMIRLSQHTAQEALASGALKLADELQDALCRPIPQGFVRMVQAYTDTGLKPGKAELEALSCLAESHPTAMRMIDNLCEKTGADYIVKHPSIEQLESDIDYIGRYGLLFDLPATNPDALESAKALFGGKYDSSYKIEPVPDKTITATGEIVPGLGDRLVVSDENEPGEKMLFLSTDGKITKGDDWDIAHLNKSVLDYQELVARLGEMSKRWSGGVYPVEKAEADEGIRIAKEIGQEQAALAEAVVPNKMKI